MRLDQARRANPDQTRWPEAPRLRGTVVLVAVLLGLAAVACGPGAEVSTGRDLYMAYGCAACHGELGAGDGPAAALSRTSPRDLRDLANYRGPSSVEGIASTIALGVADGRTGMPAYPDLPKNERIAIASYIHSLARETR